MSVSRSSMHAKIGSIISRRCSTSDQNDDPIMICFASDGELKSGCTSLLIFFSSIWKIIVVAERTLYRRLSTKHTIVHVEGLKRLIEYIVPSFLTLIFTYSFRSIAMSMTNLINKAACSIKNLNILVLPISIDKLRKKCVAKTYVQKTRFVSANVLQTLCIAMHELKMKNTIRVPVIWLILQNTFPTISKTLPDVSRSSSAFKYSMKNGCGRCTITLLPDFESLSVAPSTPMVSLSLLGTSSKTAFIE